LKFEIDAVNLQVGRLLMNGILNDERIATQQKIHRSEEAGNVTIPKSAISNFKFRISNHMGALGFDSVDL